MVKRKTLYISLSQKNTERKSLYHKTVLRQRKFSDKPLPKRSLRRQKLAIPISFSILHWVATPHRAISS